MKFYIFFYGEKKLEVGYRNKFAIFQIFDINILIEKIFKILKTKFIINLKTKLKKIKNKNKVNFNYRKKRKKLKRYNKKNNQKDNRKSK